MEKVSEAVLSAAMRVAVREGLVPKALPAEDYLRAWKAMEAVLSEALRVRDEQG